jgi:hypothetical protein
MRAARLLTVLSLLTVVMGCPRPEEAARAPLSTGRPPAQDASAPAAPVPVASAPQQASAPDASVPASDARVAPAGPSATAPDATVASTGCRKDEDCRVTRAQTQGCCEGCEARAVSAAELAAIEARQARCNKQKVVCPDMPCAPPRFVPSASCEAGACVLKLGRPELQ